MALTIISLIKQVPLPSEMRMGEDGLMDRTKAKSIINIDCTFALEAGLQIKNEYPDAKLIVCSMGPPSFEQSLKQALAMGYDEAYLLSDRRLGGSDTYATGLALSTMIRHLGFDKSKKDDFIIVAGRQTSDGDTAHIPSQVAENLGIPQATFVENATLKNNKIEAKRIIEGGYQILQLPLPCVLSFTPTGIPPRRANLKGAIKARNKSITVFNIDDINLGTQKIGLSGSPTIVAKVVNIKSQRGEAKIVNIKDENLAVEKFIENFKSGKNVLAKEKKKEKKEVKRPQGYEEYDFRGEARGILTWAEITNKKIATSSLELLTPAKELAKELGEDTKVITLLIGDDIKELAKELIAYGSDEVIVVEDKRLREYQIVPFASVFEQVIKDINPEIALFAATTAGRELAPRIGVKTGSGVTADCTSLEIGEYLDRKNKRIVYPILESKRPTYGESKLATILGFKTPQISTARAGTFKIPTKNKNVKGVIKEFKPKLTKDDFTTKIIKTIRNDGGVETLFNADIIVSGGRGTVDDSLNLVKKLSQELKNSSIKAEWACSRAVVDEGAAPYARQVGQTGKTLRPKVYIAIGISGAIQHLAGMKESDTVIAINHNPKEPIFRNCDFGIVGRYEDIVPVLIQKVKEGFLFGLKKG